MSLKNNCLVRFGRTKSEENSHRNGNTHFSFSSVLPSGDRKGYYDPAVSDSKDAVESQSRRDGRVLNVLRKEIEVLRTDRDVQSQLYQSLQRDIGKYRHTVGVCIQVSLAFSFPF